MLVKGAPSHHRVHADVVAPEPSSGTGTMLITKLDAHVTKLVCMAPVPWFCVFVVQTTFPKINFRSCNGSRQKGTVLPTGHHGRTV